MEQYDEDYIIYKLKLKINKRLIQFKRILYIIL